VPYDEPFVPAGDMTGDDPFDLDDEYNPFAGFDFNDEDDVPEIAKEDEEDDDDEDEEEAPFDLPDEDIPFANFSFLPQTGSQSNNSVNGGMFAAFVTFIVSLGAAVKIKRREDK